MNRKYIITEYEIKNGREVLYENHKTVFPGDEISKIPRIKNYANDCWVRVKMTYVNNLEGVLFIGDSITQGLSQYGGISDKGVQFRGVVSSNPKHWLCT